MVQAGEGDIALFDRMRMTMSLSNAASDFSRSHSMRPPRVVGRGVFRAVNTFVAHIIAQREQQAQMTILRQLSDRELRDIGLARTDVSAGLARAARDRTRLQRLLEARL